MRALGRLFFFFAPLVLSLPGQAASAAFDSEFDEKPWVEIEVQQFPAFPDEGDLIPFKVGAVFDKQFFIDKKSISLGNDDVIRYTLVVVSSAGAQNVSYEGMRCSTAERRLYALGQGDKTWSKARTSKWIRLQGGSNNHHVALYADYFCSGGMLAFRGVDDVERVLRHGR